MQNQSAPDSPLITFSLAATPEEFDLGRLLFREYADSLGFDLAFQDFKGELEHAESKYGPPEGALILCRTQASGQAVGCVAVRKLAGDIAELKRLYVRPDFRALHLGKRLLELALEAARKTGYKRIRLDTVASMEAALRLYTMAGFYPIAPYYANPVKDVVYMEKSL